jgi:hypothetical protein
MMHIHDIRHMHVEMLLFIIRVFIHLQLMQHVVSGQMTSVSTSPLKMFNGSTVCATDPPFQVFPSRSELDCSRTCASYVTRHCSSVNFWYSNKQCEMYSDLSINYGVTAGCIHLQVGQVFYVFTKPIKLLCYTE